MDQICPKKVFPIESGKREHHHWILSIRISLSNQVSPSTDNFNFLDKFCPKTIFPVENEEREQHHWILHIQIRLATKFQLKGIILIFWTNGAIFLDAMALLGQSRESWPSMAPLGHVEKFANEHAMGLLSQARESWPSMAALVLDHVELTKTLWHF